MHLGELKPLLSGLALPPAGPLLLVLLGLALAWRRPRAGAALAGAAALALWLLSCNAVALWLSAQLLPPVQALTPAQIRALRPPAVQAIVVLGGGVQALAVEYGEPQAARATASRLRYGAWLARQTGLPLAFSGGIGWGQDPAQAVAEATVASRLVEQDYGLRLRWVEAASRDTAENARLSRALLAPEGVQRIALVTHAWHMPRAVAAFEAAGFSVTPAPMGYLTPQARPLLEWLPSATGLEASRTVLREWLGLRLAGLRS